MNYSTEAIINQMKSQGINFYTDVSEELITKIETIYDIKFPMCIREFYLLGIPFSDDKSEFPQWFDMSDENVKRIKKWISRPNESLRESVKNGFWISKWGKRPEILQEALKQYDSISENAPALIPIFNHRYFPLIKNLGNPPVISAMACDIVFYGADFYDYLKREFLNENQSLTVKNEVPFWGDIINRFDI